MEAYFATRSPVEEVLETCPRMPSQCHLLSADIQTSWAEVHRWEAQHFAEKGERRRAHQVAITTRFQKARVLRRLFQEVYTPSTAHVFFEAVMVLDRLLLTLRRPSSVPMAVAAAACYLSRAVHSDDVYVGVRRLSRRLGKIFEFSDDVNLLDVMPKMIQALGSFGEKSTLHTSLDWFQMFLSSVPESRRPALTPLQTDKLFLAVVTLPSRTSNHRPSLLAAAVLVHLMGNEAEPYLCGLTLQDVTVALLDVQSVLRSSGNAALSRHLGDEVTTKDQSTEKQRTCVEA